MQAPDPIAEFGEAHFRASIPPIQSAIKIGQNTMRLQLDIPASDFAYAVTVLKWQEVPLDVVIKPEFPRINYRDLLSPPF